MLPLSLFWPHPDIPWVVKMPPPPSPFLCIPRDVGGRWGKHILRAPYATQLVFHLLAPVASRSIASPYFELWFLEMVLRRTIFDYRMGTRARSAAWLRTPSSRPGFARSPRGIGSRRSSSKARRVRRNLKCQVALWRVPLTMESRMSIEEAFSLFLFGERHATTFLEKADFN